MGRELPLTRLHPDLLWQTRSWRRRLAQVEAREVVNSMALSGTEMGMDQYLLIPF